MAVPRGTWNTRGIGIPCGTLLLGVLDQGLAVREQSAPSLAQNLSWIGNL